MFSKLGHVCLCVWALKGLEKCYKFPLACVPCWGGSDVLVGSYRGHEVLRGAMGQKVPEFRNKKGQSAATSLQRRPWQGPRTSPVSPTLAQDKQEQTHQQQMQQKVESETKRPGQISLAKAHKDHREQQNKLSSLPHSTGTGSEEGAVGKMEGGGNRKDLP